MQFLVKLIVPIPVLDVEGKLIFSFIVVFIFTLFCGASKGFMRAIEAIKAFEAP